MRQFHRGTAIVLFSFAAFLTLRLGYAIFSPALTTSFVQDPFQIAAFLAAMIFGFCITMAMAVMLFREKQVELELQARRDPLTGMNNRLSLQEFAEIQMATALRNKAPLSVVLFDLDHFKQINDQHGHQAGDQALKVVAECVRSATRGSDTGFRVGGEEFLIVLPGASARDAVAVAERFRGTLAKTPVELEQATLHLTASFGVVEWKPELESWDELVRRADQALYEAKKAGRNQVFAPIQAGLLVPGG
ncbi:MAG: GGDEF domain-containing protein [Wenzhouxiangella sp.]